ncbi:MAG: hypothetical protein Fur0046_07670 [Cyanobacteria bacterium J069]
MAVTINTISLDFFPDFALKLAASCENSATASGKATALRQLCGSSAAEKVPRLPTTWSEIQALMLCFGVG